MGHRGHSYSGTPDVDFELSLVTDEMGEGGSGRRQERNEKRGSLTGTGTQWPRGRALPEHTEWHPLSRGRWGISPGV